MEHQLEQIRLNRGPFAYSWPSVGVEPDRSILFKKSVFIGPTLPNSLISPLPVVEAEPKPVGGFTERGSDPAHCYRFIYAPIPGLLNRRCPSTVRPAVVSVVVDAVYAFTRWFFAHLLKEYDKGFIPFLTNFNSAPTIIRKVSAVSVVASLHHALPNLMSGRTAPAVSKVASCYNVTLKAPTRARNSGKNSGSVNGIYFTTRAPADEVSALSGFGLSNYGPS